MVAVLSDLLGSPSATIGEKKSEASLQHHAHTEIGCTPDAGCYIPASMGTQRMFCKAPMVANAPWAPIGSASFLQPRLSHSGESRSSGQEEQPVCRVS